jgi:Spy/CpxP family protein refolding chaperone
MTPSFYGVCRPLLALFLALLVSGAASAQPIQWWKLDPARTELGLTSDQSTHIEGIFQESMGQLRQQKGELDNVEGKLSRLIEASADESQVTEQIDQVEAVRSALNKTRTLMLFRMRLALTPDQRLKLNALHARWEREQRDRSRQRPSLPPDESRRSDGPRNRPN